MKNYAIISNLSVVVHNQMLVPRMNPKTEATRKVALDRLLWEMEARQKLQIGKETEAGVAVHAIHSCNALSAFHKAKEEDNTLAPTFWVKE